MVPKLPVFLLNSFYRDVQCLLITNMLYKRSAILRFFMCSGEGCVELSFRFFLFLLHGLYGALCSCVTSGLVRFRFVQCSFVVTFVDGLFICGCYFYSSSSLRMSIRCLSVIIFVRVTVTSRYLLCGVSVVADELRLSSSRRLHRLSTTFPARAYIKVVKLTIFLIILYSLLYVSLLPFFHWLPVKLG